MDFDLVAQRLAGLARRVSNSDGLRPAAVLVPLFLKDNAPHLLMVKRSGSVEHHKNQIAFPGGICEPDDQGPEDTARREAQEEIGLQREHARVLGLSHDTETITGFRITPVVAHIPWPYDFQLCPAEVEYLIEVPWRLFGNPAAHRSEQVEAEGRAYRVDFYQFGEHLIWGATARITRQLYELVELPG